MLLSVKSWLTADAVAASFAYAGDGGLDRGYAGRLERPLRLSGFLPGP